MPLIRAQNAPRAQNSLADIRLITFDLDETLWPLKPTIVNASKASTEWLIARVPEYAELVTSGAIEKIRDLVVDEDPALRFHMSNLRLRILTRALVSLGLDENDARTLAQGAFDVFLEKRQQVTLFAGMADVLARLSNRFMLGALTNGNANISRVGIGHLFAFSHSAESVERAKPYPDMFLAALASAGARAEQSIHIGDSLSLDIGPAELIGMHTIWANFGDQDRPNDRTVMNEARCVADVEPCIERILEER